jgi:hypothetical protein
VNHTVTWFVLLGACEPIHIFAWEKETANSCAENTSYHLTPGTSDMCTPGVNYRWDSEKYVQSFNM